MNGRPDPITVRYLLVGAVADAIATRPPSGIPGRVVALTYAAAALGPAPVELKRLAAAAGVGEKGARAALGGSWVRLLERLPDGRYQLAAELLDRAGVMRGDA